MYALLTHKAIPADEMTIPLAHDLTQLHSCCLAAECAAKRQAIFYLTYRGKMRLDSHRPGYVDAIVD